MLLGTLVASLLGNALAGKPKKSGRGVMRTDKETVKAGKEF